MRQCGSVRQFAAAHAAMCCSALDSVSQCGSACVAVRLCAAVRLLVCGMFSNLALWGSAAVGGCAGLLVCGCSARGSVRQCGAVCGSARAAVCGSACSGVRQCAWQCAAVSWECAAVRLAVYGCL